MLRFSVSLPCFCNFILLIIIIDSFTHNIIIAMSFRLAFIINIIVFIFISSLIHFEIILLHIFFSYHSIPLTNDYVSPHATGCSLKIPNSLQQISCMQQSNSSDLRYECPVTLIGKPFCTDNSNSVLAKERSQNIEHS